MTEYATGGVIQPGTTPRDLEEPRGVVRTNRVREDVARLDLKPGDTLVVTLREPVTTQMATTVRDRILAILGDQIDEHHLLVVPETAKLSVMRQAGVAS